MSETRTTRRPVIRILRHLHRLLRGHEVKQPMQPLVVDQRGTIRFQENAVVVALLDHCARHGLTLNELAQMGFPDEDRAQLAQLIGYSVAGYHELSYVSNEAAHAASAAAREINPAAGGCRDDGCPTHGDAGRKTR